MDCEARTQVVRAGRGGEVEFEGETERAVALLLLREGCGPARAEKEM